MKPVEFDVQAATEVWEILIWHEAKRPDATTQLIAGLSAVVEFISAHPGAGSPFKGDFRRVILKHSPYYVIYKEYETYSKIYAVMHGRRKPDYWTKRMPKN